MKTWENPEKNGRTSSVGGNGKGDEWRVGWSLVCFSSGQHGTFELVAAKVGMNETSYSRMVFKIYYGKPGFFCEHLNMMNKAQQRKS